MRRDWDKSAEAKTLACETVEDDRSNVWDIIPAQAVPVPARITYPTPVATIDLVAEIVQEDNIFLYYPHPGGEGGPRSCFPSVIPPERRFLKIV